jgi:tetratricopeptide (TPR) repeat protein
MKKILMLVVALMALGSVNASGQEVTIEAKAKVTEEVRTIQTYPFSNPNPVPMLTEDSHLYPYHRFEGYAHESQRKEWKVVKLENEWIELWILPEVGGKIWGARVKKTGNEFIYRNEVMKFRNIALRGPWTSGGIEFNFGVIGHAPSTASPVDYITRENDDGSVSVIVGAMDLPSRTHWRVEVRLPSDRAYFETRVLWRNPTTQEQAYYNWMTAAAFAQDDLVMTIPGNAYLGHPGERYDWPIDDKGKLLSAYRENAFGGNKSFHVVGEMADFFGGYYKSDDYGFGHWSKYGDMPGQKLWLWALSEQGGIWEDLLTDSDGQYVEFQAGRLLVQYSPNGDVNPISQVGFDPGATDRWVETWFPLEELQGLTQASRDGAMFVEINEDEILIRTHSFMSTEDTLKVFVNDDLILVSPESMEPLQVIAHTFSREDLDLQTLDPLGSNKITVKWPTLRLEHVVKGEGSFLSKPFTTDLTSINETPDVDREVLAGMQLLKGRELPEARVRLEAALELEEWNRKALLGMADIEFRRGRYDEGLIFAERLLQLDAYDFDANFIAGKLYRAKGNIIDATESFGWAARSMAYRSVSYLQLAELSFVERDWIEAENYVSLSLDYDAYNLSALNLWAALKRITESLSEWNEIIDRAFTIDALHHPAAVERYLLAVHSGSPVDEQITELMQNISSEYPEQTILEIVIDYIRIGRTVDALVILDGIQTELDSPLLELWRSYLNQDANELEQGIDPSFVFPYRRESIEVLQWAVGESEHWSWGYLLSLNLWARDRTTEAAKLLIDLGETPTYAPVFISRALIKPLVEDQELATKINEEMDLGRAVRYGAQERVTHMELIKYLRSSGRWGDAVSVSINARNYFPNDFDLELLHASSLNELGDYTSALKILDQIQVLPSEMSSESHEIFATANLLAGLEALAERKIEEALEYFQTSTTWPERLGLGRPFEPEERLANFLRSRALRMLGRNQEAQIALISVIDQTPNSLVEQGITEGGIDIISARAFIDLEKFDQLAVHQEFVGPKSEVLNRATELVAEGKHPSQAIVEAVTSLMSGVVDVEEKILYAASILGVCR